MLLAIGLQESRFLDRRQSGNGPARGFWMFERGGAADVLAHPHSGPLARAALIELRYPAGLAPADLADVLEHNDTAAAAFARALLWTHPDPLPVQHDADAGWRQYLDLWRPGVPRPETWRALYDEAWSRVSLTMPAVALRS